MVDFSGLHVETTNTCTLKCPRCSRTDFLTQFGTKNWTNHNLSLPDFQKFLDLDLHGKVINLCGNYGDPIYYPELFALIAWCKQAGARIQLRTNGSHRTPLWWQQLSQLLDHADTVFFAVDGIPDNFTQYRVNADWPSIRQGMDIMARSSAHTVWRYIPFAFNEHDIDTARQLSQSLGIREFEVNHSDRWRGPSDPLRPTGYQGVRDQSVIQWHQHKHIEVDAKCITSGQEHFITASGHYTPCCYSADHRFYYGSEFHAQQDQYHISNTTLSQVLLKSRDFYSNIHTAKHDFCTFNCPKI